MSYGEIDLSDAKTLRLKAEEQLKENERKTGQEYNGVDVNKLLHELQVHQIELEMQNEELRHTYEVAETALKKYTLLFDLAPMGYFTLDSDGSICELNFAGASMLGDRRFSLINSNFKLYVAEGSRPVFNEFFRKVYSRKSKETCEVMLGYNDKPLCRVYMEGVVTGDDGKCLLSVVDISGLLNLVNP